VSRDYVECAEIAGTTAKTAKIYENGRRRLRDGNRVHGWHILVLSPSSPPSKQSCSGAVLERPKSSATTNLSGTPPLLGVVIPTWNDALPKSYWTFLRAALSVAPS
jgi:hypothetical protein